MGVGGTVHSVVRLDDRIEVVVQDDSDFLAVTLALHERAMLIRPGDSLWWQGRYTYWSSAVHRARDLPVFRLGYSRSVPKE